jgi:hypothetical protein
MSEKIEIIADYTPEDYADALIAIHQRQKLVRVFGFICLFIVLATIAFLYSLSERNFIHFIFDFENLTLILMCVGVLFWLIIYKGRSPKLFIAWNVKRQFKTSPTLRETKRITVEEEGLAGNTDLSSGIVKWAAFIDAVETKKSFLFFTSKKFAQFIPKRVITLEQENEIRALVKRKMGDKAKILL